MTNQETHRPRTIKICGLREPEHAVAAAEGGADMIGFIFAPTRRYVAPADAGRAIDAAKRATHRGILAVGVFVNSPVATINAVADAAGLDIVQLSGDEVPGDLAEISRPVVKALRPSADRTPEEIIRIINRWHNDMPGVTLLLDGYHPGYFGGTGVRADWSLAADVASQHPILLAGGLDPGNVAEAIMGVKPSGVDVSTGVEIDGRKDSSLIRAFIAQARAAFSRQA